MTIGSTHKPSRLTLLGWSLGLMGLGVLGGAQAMSQLTSQQLVLPETLLHATSTDSSDAFAMATGPIDDDVEGVFVLDFLTLELQCTVMNYRTGQFDSLFKASIAQDLPIDKTKKPKYLLVTGQVNFRRGGGAARPGRSVAYVLDSNTGHFAAYGVQWRPDMAAAGKPQGGPLTLLGTGKARAAVIRGGGP